MYVKPAEGLLVRNPKTLTLLPVEGAEVQESSYWLKRIEQGDVIVCKPPKADKKAEA